MLVTPANNGVVVVFDKGAPSLDRLVGSVGPLLKHPRSGKAYKDKIGDLASSTFGVGHIVGKGGVVDASVETAKDEGVHLLEGLDSCNGGFGNGGL